MHRDSERHKLFSRRAAIVTGGMAVLLSALAARMYYLQVVEASRYRTLAEENRINLRLLPSPRGRIVDRFGLPMADNQQNYRVLLNAEDARDVEAILDVLGTIIPISAGEKRRILREIRRNRRFVPATVRENLNWQEVARIEVNAPDLPGVNIDVGQSRYYPHGADTAHVLGYVAPVSPSEVTGDPLHELPGFRIGKSGIEKIRDLQLRGTGGSLQVEVNAFGHVIRELTRQDGQAGAEVALTIDLELQKFASRRFKGEGGAVVVIDIHNGDVLALTSTPGFDPNDFNKGLSTEQWRALTTNSKAPLINKAVSGQFSPGSIFKMVVLLAALEKGAITPAKRFLCTGEFDLGEATFHCWNKDGHGWMDAFNGVMQSCDVYFYEIARRTGIERIASMARRLGFGSTLGVDLPGEKPGLVPSREWKRKTMNAPWHQGETVLTGIGQGYLLATPLQMAVMTAQLANGGLKVTPRLTRSRFAAKTGKTDPGRQFESLNLVPQHLQLVRQAMEGVVNKPLGTAYRERIRKRGMAMGGKTGTVQVRRITKAEREQGVKKNKDLPWKERDHAMFVAFAPIDAPRYAVTVVVEHGGSGSKVAAPIARDILIKAQQHRSARPGILPKAPDGGQQVMGPRGNKPGNKPGARSRDEG